MSAMVFLLANTAKVMTRLAIYFLVLYANE